MSSSEELYAFAQRYIPGGVSASARVNKAIGHPLFIARGDGPRIYDVDGRSYVDMCVSHGASLLGHNHPKIKAAVARALDLGIICSYETEYHSAAAKKITEVVPCAEMVRFSGTGTETVMHALRLARAFTGRSKIIKFEGHFHGYCDYIFYSSAPPLSLAGPASAPVPYAQCAGIPEEIQDLIVVVPFNDPDALEAAFAQHGPATAALILEPVNFDAGCVIAKPHFLELCRELCTRYGSLLFFDEVLTAFRIALGGAQEYYGVAPDLAVLGKAIGAGVPISAIVGSREIMLHLRPVGDSEHSGTYMAHLTGVLAAQAALDVYSQPGFYERLKDVGDRFYAGFQEIIDRSGVPARLQHLGPRFCIYFGLTEEVTNYRQVALQDEKLLLTFIAGCIQRGVYFHVSPHHGFSAAHTDADLAEALNGIEGAMGDVKKLLAPARHAPAR